MLRRILLIEDEPAIAENIVYALRTEAFDPVWCSTGEEALTRLAGGPVLHGDPRCRAAGYERLRSLPPAARALRVPIIFVTARKEEIDRVVGLEIGADDYIVKPFSPRELTARVKAILRRTEAHAAPLPAAPAAQLVVDEERCEIRYLGVPLALSRYEYRLLKVLAQNPGRVFSREQLMEQAWDEPESAFDRTVDAHIKTLRAKLRAVRDEEDPIRTHRGMGYSLKEQL